LFALKSRAMDVQDMSAQSVIETRTLRFLRSSMQSVRLHTDDFATHACQSTRAAPSSLLDGQAALKGSNHQNRTWRFEIAFMELNMLNRRPQPPQPDRIRFINGSFSWIDHLFLRQGFDQGLTRLEKLFYFVLISISNKDGVS
jgi:hypothetical protein